MRLGEYPPASWAAHDGAWRGAASPEPVWHDLNALAAAPEQPAGHEDSPEAAALAALGLSKPLLARLGRQARQNGTSIETELLHSGQVSETAYYGAIARLLRLSFFETIDPASVLDTPFIDAQLRQPNQIRIAYRYRAPQVAVVPQAMRLADFAASLSAMPMLGRDLVVTTPSAIRQAVWKTGCERRVRDTVDDLFDRSPHFSARIVLAGNQGFYAGLGLAALLSALVVMPLTTLLVLHILLSFVYFASLILRFAALRRRMPKGATLVSPDPAGPPPCYTVMVALYQEAAVAEQLVAGLLRLDWPPSRLDIKLVCEADDHETIAALKAQPLPAHIEIVEVPSFGPRTKPKALTYALGAARGEFLAVYDAEDRPHPQQLREAYGRFRASPPQLACLQAPLIITNGRDSWISALFSLEYSGLFRGLLPMLAGKEMPLPLGGTSNHFRTEALRAAGGWDPFNVTEDADLGLRLYRLGYRSGVIARHTFEDAPTTMNVWMKQRSRWFKGWLQTWLVLMRKPRQVVREMGLPAFLVFQLTIGGMLLSSLLHPLIIVFMGLGAHATLAAPADEMPIGALALFVIDTVNILGSYLTFLALGMNSMIAHEKRLIGRRWAGVPLYWLMTSVAAWRAVQELRSRPFFWNKTPHVPSVRKGPLKL